MASDELPFDVFLSYNSEDRTAVARVAERLRRERVEAWWDRWHLTPGGSWQAEIVAGLAASKACAVVVGPAGLGDWAREELAVALDRAAKERAFRLFMVLLPGAPELSDPSLAFLRMRTWVDLRQGLDDRDGIGDLIAAITGIPRRREPAVTSPQMCPYRGLEAFEEDHAELFFGRDNEVALAVEKLRASRFLAVLGPSGSGKSSLVRAGIVPAIRRGALSASESFTIRVFSPGARPLTALAAQLVRLFPGEAMPATFDRLRDDRRSVDLAVSLAWPSGPPTSGWCSWSTSSRSCSRCAPTKRSGGRSSPTSPMPPPSRAGAPW